MTACDVLVACGGPAGTALALELARRGSLSVLVVEDSSYDQPRIGETLSPGARGILDYLDRSWVLDADGHLAAHGTSAAWGSAQLATRESLMTPFGSGWHLDRRRFDARLGLAAERVGATVWRRSRVGEVTAEPGGCVVDLHRRERVESVRTRFLVDATGKSALVARRLGADRQRLDRQVGLAVTFRFPSHPPADLLTLVEACEDGWFYTATVPGGGVVVVLITDADIAWTHQLTEPDRWRASVDRLPHTAQRLADGEPTTGPQVVAAHSACLLDCTGPNLVAVGDAAASQDPLSSTGIARALESGIQAGHAIQAALVDANPAPMTEYARRQSVAFDHYCDTRASYYEIERRWPDAPFWRRRHRRLTLDPRSVVTATVPRTDRAPVPRLPADLRHVDPDRLLTLAACEPHRAHAVLDQYRAGATHAVRDLDLVLALQ